jgi:hypothetical protein
MSPTIATTRLAEILLVVADGVHVEQALRRMGVSSVAGIDHMHVVSPEAAQVVGDQVRRAAGRVPDDEHVGVHGDQIVDRVEQGLALGGRGAGDVEVDDVRGQALGGDLEGGARARRVLEKDVEDALAAQQGHLLDVAIGHLEKARRGVEDLVITSRGRPSIDSRWVSSPLALSWGLRIAGQAPLQATVGIRERISSCDGSRSTCQGQKSAQIGSWRRPRSARTASWMLAGRP